MLTFCSFAIVVTNPALVTLNNLCLDDVSRVPLIEGTDMCASFFGYYLVCVHLCFRYFLLHSRRIEFAKRIPVDSVASMSCCDCARLLVQQTLKCSEGIYSPIALLLHYINITSREEISLISMNCACLCCLQTAGILEALSHVVVFECPGTDWQEKAVCLPSPLSTPTKLETHSS